jgi:uncharacterized protein (TIGR03083 family)
MEAEVKDREELLAQIDQEWAALSELIEGLDDAEMEDPVLENGWSVKDVLAHIMSWEQKLVEWAGALVAGQEPQRPFAGDDWIDRVNEQVYDHYRDVPLEDVLDAARRSHAEVVGLVQELDSADLFERDRFSFIQGAPLWRMVAANTFWHYREHRQMIAETLA